MWLLLVNPNVEFAFFLFFFRFSSCRHTNRFARNQVIESRARSSQGRASDARRSEPWTARTRDRASGYERNGEIHFSICVFPIEYHLRVGLVVSWGDWIPPTFYPCPELTGTPDAACAL
jgi:hypothetical protein